MASADHAAAQVMRIIQSVVPVKKHLAVGLRRTHTGGALGRIDLNPADSASVLVAKLDSHAMAMISAGTGGLKQLRQKVRPNAALSRRVILQTHSTQCIVAAMGVWITQLAGKFIVFDGPDGSGKTTQFDRFTQHCRQGGVTVCEVREPGGTAIGEQIRKILLDPASGDMSLRCEMMLYMASRAQLVEQIIGPALGRGELVLADRFISSTLAYQGAAGGLSQEQILAVGRVAVQSIRPDLTVIFDVDECVAGERLPDSPLLDRVERRGGLFHSKVRKGFLAQAEAHPDKYLVIPAAGDPDSIFETLLKRLQERLT